ncbi:MAG: FGLLP motif-containing membrane protein, partial [Pyrinomonadaceae bacterium]
DIGSNPVTSSCDNSGKPVRQTTQFRVTEADVHRPAFLTALPGPGDVPLDPTRILLSALVGLGAIALLAFPYQLFNSTLEENYEEVRGWFGLKPKPPDYVPPHQLLLLPFFLLASGLLFAALSPDFGLNQTTLVLAAGLAIAVFTTGVGFAQPGFIYMLRQGDRGRIRVLPGSVVVGAVTVLISRLVGFTPGYVYGLLAVLVFRKKLDRPRQGRMATLISLFVFAVCLAAWFIRVPVSSAAREPDPNVLILILEAALGGIFLFGLESLIVDLIPMRFLDGSRIKAWSQVVWGTLFAFGLFVLVHVLIIPGSGYVGVSDNLKLRIVVVVLYLVFGAISVGFWAYFRYRRPRGGTDWSAA